MRFAVQREHQRDGVFGDGIGRIGRNADDMQALIDRFQIHIVISRTAQRNELDVVFEKRLGDFGGQLVIHEQADDIMPIRDDGGVFGQMAAEKFERELIGAVGGFK